MQFKTSELGVCKQIPGVQVNQLPIGTFLSQRPYIGKIIEASGMEDKKPTRSPLALSCPIYED